MVLLPRRGSGVIRNAAMLDDGLVPGLRQEGGDAHVLPHSDEEGFLEEVPPLLPVDREEAPRRKEDLPGGIGVVRQPRHQIGVAEAVSDHRRDAGSAERSHADVPDDCRHDPFVHYRLPFPKCTASRAETQR